MSKKRAFVGYTKSGQIRPGSLIFTDGTYPSGPGLWYEVATDYCCETVSTTTTVSPVTFTLRSPGLTPIVGFISTTVDKNPGPPISLIIDWGDGTIEDLGSDDAFSLSHMYPDNNDYDVILTVDDPSLILGLNIQYLSFINLSFFPNLTQISFDDIRLSYLDFSNNLNLNLITIVNSSYFTSINISNNIALTNLNLYNTFLSSINLTNNVNLQSANLNTCKLTSADFSHCPNIVSINLNDNSLLSSLNVTNCTNLATLELASCNYNQALNISTCTNLVALNVANNFLPSLDVSNQSSLQQLVCNNNTTLGTVSVTNKPVLTLLVFPNCGLTSLTLTNCPILNYIDLSANNLTSIDLTLTGATSSVNNVIISSNPNLTFVDISTFTQLRYFTANNCKLPSSNINSILQRLVANSINGPAANCTTNLQNPLAPPTGAGVGYKATLQARSWIVNTD